MKKAGQITIFMILVLTIFLVGALYFHGVDKGKSEVAIKKQQNVILDKESISIYFDDCIKNIEEDSLLLFGLQGGNMEISKSENPALLVKTYYEYGKNTVPSINELEKAYSTYLEQHLPSCLDKIEFPGYEINLGKVDVNTRFYNDFVDVNVDYPLTIKNKDSEIRISKCNRKYSVRVGHIYNTSNNIVNKFVQNPNRIEYSYLMKFKEDKFFIVPYSKSLFVILIQDDKSSIRDKKYSFAFGLTFNDTKEGTVKQEIKRILA